jgi:hypothetical protein
VHLGDLSNDPLLVAGVLVLGGALALVAALAVMSWVWGRGADPGPARPPATAARAGRPARPSATLRQEWQRLTAHASAAADRAARARAEAGAARERSVAAEELRDVAWYEYETAESPVLAVPHPAPPPAPGADGTPAEEGLAHAAFVAFRRGAISVRELQRVWSRPAQADPEEEERRRVVAEWAARERDARRAYHRAATAAQLALEQARVAEVAADALATEAAEAEREAREAQEVVRRYLRRS